MGSSLRKIALESLHTVQEKLHQKIDLCDQIHSQEFENVCFESSVKTLLTLL